MFQKKIKLKLTKTYIEGWKMSLNSTFMTSFFIYRAYKKQINAIFAN